MFLCDEIIHLRPYFNGGVRKGVLDKQPLKVRGGYIIKSVYVGVCPPGADRVHIIYVTSWISSSIDSRCTRSDGSICKHCEHITLFLQCVVGDATRNEWRAIRHSSPVPVGNSATLKSVQIDKALLSKGTLAVGSYRPLRE